MTFTALGDQLAITLPGGTALFTTRRGGVSDGPFASLNLGLRTDDDPDHVRKNRGRVERLTGGRRDGVDAVSGGFEQMRIDAEIATELHLSPRMGVHKAVHLPG